MIAADGLSAAFAVLLIGAAALSVLLSVDHLRREGLEARAVLYPDPLATSGALMMAAAADLIAVFIGLEGALDLALRAGRLCQGGWGIA
jgi:NADH:ubiquinone oxidoreductase subunit 2 (subunit N)